MADHTADRKGKAAPDRRSFLKLAGIGTLTGGAALALARTPAEASPADAEKAGSYRETEHVKTFYRSARF